MTGIAKDRRVAHVSRAAFEPMRIDDRVCDDVWWHNVSFDEKTGCGSYLMLLAPGASSNPHQHLGMEEFYVLEGELVLNGKLIPMPRQGLDPEYEQEDFDQRYACTRNLGETLPP